MVYSLDAIRRRPGRSAATVVGIGLSTGLVVLLLALSSGVQTSATRLAASSGIDLLATSANTSISDGTFPPVLDAHRVPSQLSGTDPNVASASPWLLGDLVFANSSLFAASNLSANGTGVPADWGPTSGGAVGWIPDDNGGLETPATLFTTTVLLMSVDDRSRELALLRAIGYTRARIGGLVLQEGLFLGALGLGLGLVVGTLGAYGLNAFLDRLLPGLPAGFSFVSIDATVVAGGSLEVLVIGVLASLAPAARAMGIPVAEELRAP